MKLLAIPFITSLALLVTSSNATAEGRRFFQQPPTDTTVPKKALQKVRVTVKDLMDGAGLDSVFVGIGGRRAYTNNKGVAELDSVVAGTMIVVSKSGYLSQSRKSKKEIVFRLSKRNLLATTNNYNNELFERPIEYFPGSATTISGNELRRVNPLNFAEALKYYDPSFVVTRDNLQGDDPNVAPSVKIRGSYNFPASASIASQTGNPYKGLQLNPSTGDYIASNISNPNQPVVLMNGMQVSLQTALDIDINRIEKITLLKDASATAIYGVRGGNGLLLIQTKKPQKGNLNINYSGQVQVTTANLSSYNLMDAAEKLQLEQAAGFYTNNPSLYQSRLDQVNKGVNTNWLEIPTRTGVGYKHSLSLEGGDDELSYGADFSYNNIAGTMKGSNRKNLNFGGYMSSRIKNLVIGNYLTYLNSNAQNSPYGSLNEYANQNAYWSPYDSVNGGMKRMMEEYNFQGNTVRFFNPAYNGTISTTDEHIYSRLSNTTTLNWMIGHGFQVDGRLGITRQSDEVNTFLPPTHTSYATLTPDEFFKRGQYNQITSEFLNLEGAANLHYNKKIDRHRFYASLGASAIETRSESSGIELIGFSSDKLSDLSFGNAYSNARPETGKIVTRLASGYGNFTYSYDSRYQVEISGNADASSQFGQNNRIAPHWAVGASWNLHQEKFLQNNSIVNQLRLRGSVGTTGNLYFQSYLGRTSFNYYTDRQYVQGNGGTSMRGIGLGAFLTGFGNKDLEAPETQKQNIGLDVVLLKNRLSLRLDIYRNRMENLVLPVVSPASTGLAGITYYDNLGTIENKGIEFDVNYSIINNVRKGINWSIRFNGLRSQDRVLSIPEYINRLNDVNETNGDQTRPQPRYIVGQSLTGIWAVRSLGIDPATGHEKFQKADGSETFTWDATDKILAGDMTPDWLGSFGTTFSIKNITAGIYFNYQLGAEVYNQTLADRLENADLTYNVDRRAAANRWVQPGDNALYKPLSFNGLITSPTYATTRFVEKNDFINCSAISLDYSLSQNIAQKIKAKSVTLGLMANNPFQTGSSKNEKGIYYPIQRLYSFSLTAGF